MAITGMPCQRSASARPAWSLTAKTFERPPCSVHSDVGGARVLVHRVRPPALARPLHLVDAAQREAEEAGDEDARDEAEAEAARHLERQVDPRHVVRHELSEEHLLTITMPSLWQCVPPSRTDDCSRVSPMRKYSGSRMSLPASAA